MKKMLLASVVLLSTIVQAGAFELVKKVPLPAERFSVDIMGNIYWSEGSSLVRLNPLNGNTTEYNNTFLGDIHSWDNSNPMKVMVFHKDFNTLVFLDQNMASIRSPVRLDQLGITRAAGCCLSHSGGFWVLDQTSGQIKHYNASLEMRQETTSFPRLFSGIQDKPIVREHNRKLYCLVPGCCMLIFDRFGSLQRRHPLKNVDNIQILKENIYYFYEGDLYRMDKEFQRTKKVELPEGNGQWDFARMGTQNLMYLLQDQQLYIYKN